MIIDLRKIKRSGKDTQEFFFEYPIENFDTGIPNVNVVSPVKITGCATLTGEHSALIEGEIDFALKGECSRCLENAEREYVVEFSEEVSNEEESNYQVNNDTINLAKIVEDYMYSEMPINFLCDENCKGICFGCGINLNKGECKCKK